MLIYKLAKIFETNRVGYAIVGGFAVALHGAVRGTIDIDIILKLTKRDFLKAEESLKSLGLEPKLPVTAGQVFDFRDDYIKNRNLVAWNFSNPQKSSEVVDIIITHDLKKMKIINLRSGGYNLKVLSVNDLIKMKKSSGRPQDLEDIKALKELQK
jgi:hypothetical protein